MSNAKEFFDQFSFMVRKFYKEKGYWNALQEGEKKKGKEDCSLEDFAEWYFKKGWAVLQKEEIRIEEGRAPTVCVDLDGVIFKDGGWKGKEHFGELVEGAKLGLNLLKEEGWQIIIYTVRGDEDLVRAALNKSQIPFDYINENPDQPEGTSQKVIADCYLDDRAIQFTNWMEAIGEIKSFYPEERRW